MSYYSVMRANFLLLSVLLLSVSSPCWADATSLQIDLPGISLFETRKIPAVLWMPALKHSELVIASCKQVAPKNPQFLNEFVNFLDEDTLGMDLETSSGPEQYFFTRCGYSTIWQLTGNRFKYLSEKTSLIFVYDATRRTIEKLQGAYSPYLRERLELKTSSRLKPMTGYPPPKKPLEVDIAPKPYTQPRIPLTADEIVHVKKQADEHRAQLVALAGADAVDQLDIRLDSILKRHPAMQESEAKTTGAAD